MAFVRLRNRQSRMRELRFVLSGVVFILTCFAERPSCHAQVRMSQTQVDTLLLDLHHALLTYHPFAYERGARAKLDSVLALTRTDLRKRFAAQDSLEYSDILLQVLPFSDAMQDGHFQLTPKYSRAQREHLKRFGYDLQLVPVQDGQMVLPDTLEGVREAYPPGTEVIAIDGYAIDSLAGRLSLLVGLDDHGNRSAQRLAFARYPLAYYQREVGPRDSVEVTLRMTHPLRPGTIDVWEVLYPDSTVASPGRRGRRRRARQRMEQLIRLDTTTHPDIARLVIRTFSRSAFNRADEYAHLRRLFKSVADRKVQALVIDVRGNTGGSLGLVNHVLAYLLEDRAQSIEHSVAYHKRALGKGPVARWRYRMAGQVRQVDSSYYATRMAREVKPKRRAAFRGPVAVLVNEMSFSGATTLANVIQSSGRGIVVGQTAGGSAERMYAGKTFKVPVGPGDRLQLNMPLYFMKMPGEQLGNLQPDYIVERRIEDVVAGEDATLKTAVEQLSLRLSDD